MGIVQEIYKDIKKIDAEAGNLADCKSDCQDDWDACVNACGSISEAEKRAACETACAGSLSQCEDLCGRGWYFDFVNSGEKVISAPIVLDSVLVFGTYTPPDITVTSDPCNAGGTCVPGRGRVYVVSTCDDAFSVKAYKLLNNPMPQPSLVFDSESGKILISTGDGAIIDPKIPVVVPDYWKHSGADL